MIQLIEEASWDWDFVLNRVDQSARGGRDEDDSRTGNGDHRQGGKVGDQVNVKAHGDAALSKSLRLRVGALSQERRIGSNLCDGLSQLPS